MAAITFSYELPARFLDAPGQRAGFVLLAAFLLSFLFIRTSARLMRSPKVPWWPGSVKTGSGLHLHHLVFGIGLLLAAGFLGFATNSESPWNEILAGVFGVGAGLTLDEFALWVHLRDVYWAEEGRASFDAVVVTAVLGGLVVLGIAPFDLPNNASSVSSLVISVLSDVALAALVIFKGKRLLGLFGLFVPPTLLVGAFRLASPSSPWARRFYKPGGRALLRARQRYERIDARRQRLRNAIAGAPEMPTARAIQAEPAARGDSTAEP